MLTLDEAKAQLRVDHADDDTYIASLVAVAQEYIQGMVTPAPVDGEPAIVSPVNETQRHAARLLVGLWYENREAASDKALKNIPFAINELLRFNRPAESFF
jgi:uncharacterized phage protein (predicted DNA packaging)